MRKIIAVIAALFIAAALALTAVTPASAAVPADGIVTNPDGSKTETKSTVDGGGIAYTASVTWGPKYYDANDKLRVSVPKLTIYRPDSTTPKFAEDDGLDAHFDVIGGNGKFVQHKIVDGVDLDVATDDQWSINPKNPPSDVGDTYVRVRMGTDADGKPMSIWLKFYQPEGLPAAA